jgi:hypothetical protein
MIRRFALVATVAVSLSTQGCLGLQFGGGSTIHEAVTPPTLGKELEDLSNAYKNKAITQDEYEAAKLKLLTEGRKY